MASRVIRNNARGAGKTTGHAAHIAKSRSVKQKCPHDCDEGWIHGDNGGDGSEMHPLRNAVQRCPLCNPKPAQPNADTP